MNQISLFQAKKLHMKSIQSHYPVKIPQVMIYQNQKNFFFLATPMEIISKYLIGQPSTQVSETKNCVAQEN